MVSVRYNGVYAICMAGCKSYPLSAVWVYATIKMAKPLLQID